MFAIDRFSENFLGLCRSKEMLISTFELLVKSQLPSTVSPPVSIPPSLSALSRAVVQGYFLSISNLNNSQIVLSLVFTAVSPPLSALNTIIFVDADGNNVIGDVSPEPPNRSRFTLTLNANDTGLFILQPDIISNPNLLNTKDFEVRGYAEVFISSLSPIRQGRILITPEQRGTFFKDLNAVDPQLDQVVYSLPTSTGGSLFTLRATGGGEGGEG
jgi:hypothetical protein